MILPGSQFPIMGRPLEFEEVQSLPAMTNNTTPTGHIVSASTVWSPMEPFYAFDQIINFVPTDRWSPNTSNAYPSWIQRQTPSPITVWKYRIRIAETAIVSPRDFSLQGSDDGISFTTIDSRSGVTAWSSWETKEFEVSGPLAAYTHHRLSVTAGNGTHYGITEFELLQVF